MLLLRVMSCRVMSYRVVLCRVRVHVCMLLTICVGNTVFVCVTSDVMLSEGRTSAATAARNRLTSAHGRSMSDVALEEREVQRSYTARQQHTYRHLITCMCCS